MRYEYKCTSPMLPRGTSINADSPVMDYKQMGDWLNEMGEDGWEFVGQAEKRWEGSEPFIQSWWIFKRELKEG